MVIEIIKNLLFEINFIIIYYKKKFDIFENTILGVFFMLTCRYVIKCKIVD